MSLVEAIGEAVQFVKKHANLMTRQDMNKFQKLAETVYVEAVNAKLEGSLPKVDEQQVEFADMCRAHYATKLNLPGDWDEGDFLVVAPPRWFEDMGTLCRLAKERTLRPPTKPKRKPGRKSNIENDRKIAREYAEGLEEGSWAGQADYLRQKHKARYSKSKNNATSWLSKLLDRVAKKDGR